MYESVGDLSRIQWETGHRDGDFSVAMGGCIPRKCPFFTVLPEAGRVGGRLGRALDPDAGPTTID